MRLHVLQQVQFTWDFNPELNEYPILDDNKSNFNNEYAYITRRHFNVEIQIKIYKPDISSSYLNALPVVINCW